MKVIPLDSTEVIRFYAGALVYTLLFSPGDNKIRNIIRFAMLVSIGIEIAKVIQNDFCGPFNIEIIG